jgi:predicted AlkP superfamily phosphohydrolase/phosphomutase
MRAPRLTVIGLDAATFDVIDPLIAGGDLPNLARLTAGGASGPLRSTTHPLTPQAWTTMVTGVNAGRHGIWDFQERFGSGYDLRFVNGSYRAAPAFWDHLHAAGRRVGLVNVPFTWPPPPVDGFVVSGFDTAVHDDMTHPHELYDELQERFGELDLDHRFPIGANGEVDVDAVRSACEQKVAVTRWLVERYEPDLLFVVFMSADHIHHVAWTDWEERGPESTVAAVYRILDEAVGELAALGGDVMTVSDHGGGSLKGVVNLNAWLADEGFLTYLDPRSTLGTRALRRALALRRTLLPESARRRMKRMAPELSERVARRSARQVVDLGRTRAFAYGNFGNIVVNLRGREEHGIVAPGAEYDAVRQEIGARLLELRSPEGERIVRAVHRREELFDGPSIEKVPDLIVEFDEYAWLGKGNLSARTPTIWDEVQIEPGSSYAYVGSHRPDGMITLTGPSAAEGVALQARIEDVAPTVLYLMGEPIPFELEGRVLFEALAPDVVEDRPPEYADAGAVRVGAVESYSSSEAEQVEGRLRGLGYLD